MKKTNLELNHRTLEKILDRTGEDFSLENIKLLETLYNLGVENILETMAYYMMQVLIEERTEIEQEEIFDGLEVVTGEDMYCDIMRSVLRIANENFKLGFMTAFRMSEIANDYFQDQP